jgi:hypothetical protein
MSALKAFQKIMVLIISTFPKYLINAMACKLSQLVGANFDKSYL